MKHLKIFQIFTRYHKAIDTLCIPVLHPNTIFSLSSLKTKLGWQTFIEPLPAHSGWPSGWSFLCDILLRLPLSIFLKVVNITYQIEGLETYLKHPIKQYVLLKHLPMDIRQGLILLGSIFLVFTKSSQIWFISDLRNLVHIALR